MDRQFSVLERIQPLFLPPSSLTILPCLPVPAAPDTLSFHRVTDQKIGEGRSPGRWIIPAKASCPRLPRRDPGLAAAREAGGMGKPSLTLQRQQGRILPLDTGKKRFMMTEERALLPLMNFKVGKGCDITLGADFPRIYSRIFAKQTLSVNLESQNSLSDLRKILSAGGAGTASSAPRGLV